MVVRGLPDGYVIVNWGGRFQWRYLIDGVMAQYGAWTDNREEARKGAVQDALKGGDDGTD